jgi:hypothetical protein
MTMFARYQFDIVPGWVCVVIFVLFVVGSVAICTYIIGTLLGWWEPKSNETTDDPRGRRRKRRE